MEKVTEKLDLIIELQKKQQKDIDALKRHLVSINDSLRINTHNTQENATLVRRLGPRLEKAKQALHQAFHMICSGILNQREEISEFAGNIINEELTIKYV